MNKIVVTLITIIFSLGSLCCQAVELTDEDTKDMDKLHDKLVRMKKELDWLMKEVIMTTPVESGYSGAYGQDVKVDMQQDDKNIMVTADLPGMDKDRIDITLENSRILKISGMREVVKKEATPNMVKQEREYGKFERILELPCECKAEGIKAAYKNGVLELVIPKKEASKKESVKIKVN